MAENQPVLDVRIAAMSLQWGNPRGADLPGWLKRVRALGFEGVSGFAWWGWEDHLSDPAGFGRMLADAGLELASMDAAVVGEIDRYEPVLDFMAALDCRHLVCISADRKTTDAETEAEWLNAIGRRAMSRGIRACYHHHTGGVGETRAETDRVLSRVDPQCVFPMLESGHATKDFVDRPVEDRAAGFARDYAGRLAFVEFKDWSPETDLNTPLGEGQCAFEAVRDALVDAAYSGWIVIEQNGQSGPSKGRDADACARISRGFVRELLGA